MKIAKKMESVTSGYASSSFIVEKYRGRFTEGHRGSAEWMLRDFRIRIAVGTLEIRSYIEISYSVRARRLTSSLWKNKECPRADFRAARST